MSAADKFWREVLYRGYVYGVVYLITNKINGKQYVGQTIHTPEKRWRDHCRVKDNNYFHRAIRKYGCENFTLKILDHALSEKELDEKEIFWIKKLNTQFPNGYNLREGGNVSGRGNSGVNNPKSQLIYQFDLDGRMINGYYGASDAERITGINNSAIHRCLKHGKPLAGGYLWVYANSFCPEKISSIIAGYRGNKWRSVICVETGEQFKSMTEAARKYGTYPGSISACCAGKLKTTAGLHWKYGDLGGD